MTIQIEARATGVPAVRRPSRAPHPAVVRRVRRDPQVQARARRSSRVLPRDEQERQRAPRARHVPVDSAREESYWLAAVGVFTFFLMVLVGVVGLQGSHSPVPVETTLVQVRAGDTLWEFAGRFAPDSDPQRVVERIVEINGLVGSAVTPGAALEVPLER